MPTHTPSPHRFLAPTPSASKPKPPSNLRNSLVAAPSRTNGPKNQKTELQFKKLTPAKRFVVTPGRPRISTGLDFDEQDGSKPSEQNAKTQLTPRPKPKRPFERVESIEDASQSSSIAPQDEDAEPGVMQSIEQDSSDTEEEGRDDNNDDDDDQKMLFQPPDRSKRRRVSLPSSPPPRQQLHAQTPISPPRPMIHQFKTPGHRKSVSLVSPSVAIHSPFITTASHTPGLSMSTGPTTPAPSRPHFLLPALPTSPPKPSKSLPEIFSPSRKSGRYLPTGFASTVSSWIIETANSGYAAQTGVTWGSRQRDDGVKLRVRISGVSRGFEKQVGEAREEEEEIDCFTGGIAFVRGMTEPGMYNASRAPLGVDDDAQLRVLLAGQGGARGTGGIKVRVGGVVGIRQPLWDIDVGGEKWFVAVDWMVL